MIEDILDKNFVAKLIEMGKKEDFTKLETELPSDAEEVHAMCCIGHGPWEVWYDIA